MTPTTVYAKRWSTPTTVYTKSGFTPTTFYTKPRFVPTTAYTSLVVCCCCCCCCCLVVCWWCCCCLVVCWWSCWCCLVVCCCCCCCLVFCCLVVCCCCCWLQLQLLPPLAVGCLPTFCPPFVLKFSMASLDLLSLRSGFYGMLRTGELTSVRSTRIFGVNTELPLFKETYKLLSQPF